MSTSLWVPASRGTSFGTATIEESDDSFTLAAHGLVDGQQVTVAALAGGAVGVLVVDAPYFVANATASTFQLRPSPGAPVMSFTADGGCAVHDVDGLYGDDGLRKAFAGLFARGDVAGGFGARPGILPGNATTTHVTVSGMTWTVGDLVAIVQHSTNGMYVVAHDSENGPVPAADPSQPRLDGIDLGFDGVVTYVTGTPSAVPVAPTVTANSERLSTISVLAGSTTPTIATGPRFTVTRGGIIPVANAAAYPTAGGRYEGLALWNMETNELVVNMNAGSTWSPIASLTSFASLRRVATVERTTNSSTFTSEAVIASITAPVESGKRYKITWTVDSSSTAAGDTARWRIRENNISGTSRQFVQSSMPASGQDYAAPPVTFEWTAASTGNQTWVGTCHRALGTGTFSCNANANEPSYFTVDQVL